MKKTWMYVVLIIALAIGFFYIVLEKPEPEEPIKDQEQGQIDKDVPGEPGTEPDKLPEEGVPEDGDELPQEEIELDDDENDGNNHGTSDIPEVGKPLPDFTLENLKGEQVTLSEVKDKIILVNFWATWCTWCDKEMPDLQKLKEENDDLMVIAVNVEESKEKAQKYITEGGYDFEVVLDEKGNTSAQYLVSGLPASYFVDKNGKFVGRVPGMMTYEQMNEVLNNIRDLE